jgi:O-antigen/teichoic acid export membrane protein
VANLVLVNSPDGYAEMGLFSAANQWRTLLLFLPNVVSAPLLPILAQLQANDEWDRLRRLLLRCMAGNAVLVGVCAIALALVAVPIMSLYGNGFEVGAPVLVAMLVVAVLLAIGTVVGQLMVSTGKMWFGVTVNLIWGVILVGAAALFVPRHGALGLGLAYVVAYAIHTLLQLGYFWRRLGLMKGVGPCPQALETGQVTLGHDA